LFLILTMFCLKGKEARKTNSLNPMVQAVTVNVRDGALKKITHMLWIMPYIDLIQSLSLSV